MSELPTHLTNSAQVPGGGAHGVEVTARIENCYREFSQQMTLQIYKTFRHSAKQKAGTTEPSMVHNPISVSEKNSVFLCSCACEDIPGKRLGRNTRTQSLGADLQMSWLSYLGQFLEK